MTYCGKLDAYVEVPAFRQRLLKVVEAKLRSMQEHFEMIRLCNAQEAQLFLKHSEESYKDSIAIIAHVFSYLDRIQRGCNMRNDLQMVWNRTMVVKPEISSADEMSLTLASLEL